MNALKNVSVSFVSDEFNTSEEKPYFINPCCYGDDLVRWLMDQFKANGVSVEEDGPDQEDFGWYLNFTLERKEYSCIVLYQENVSRWLCVLEYNVGLLGSLFGKRNKRVPIGPARMLNDILTKHPRKISDVQWSNTRT